MASLSKFLIGEVLNRVPAEWIIYFIQMSRFQKVILTLGASGLFSSIAYYIYRLIHGIRKRRREQREARRTKTRKIIPTVNLEFFNQMKTLLGIIFPKFASPQTGILFMHTATLAAKTFLSIHVAKLEGKIVKEIVQRKVGRFIALLSYWFLVAVPSCFLNSAIRFLEKRLAMSFRTRLVQHAYDEYFKNEVYYKVGNLDTRIPNPDHSLTDDITVFSESTAHLYSHITKPLLDALLVSLTLLSNARRVGSNLLVGPLIVSVVISSTGEILKRISPKFGQLVAEEAEAKAHLRHGHSRIVTNSEEIAFYRGDAVEKKILEESFAKEQRSSRKIYFAKLWYIVIEQYLMKYLWSGTGMVLVAIPILTSAGLAGNKSEGEATRTEYYLTTKNLLSSGADAVERLMTSYKEIVELAGYASRVEKIFTVFKEVAGGKYVRESCLKSNKLTLGHVEENKDNLIVINKVEVVTPNGDIIVPDLSLTITPKMHVLITGPNGCGKSSLFRLLSGLWPVYGGSLSRPPVSSLYYIPQRPYMSQGSLRDQIIYPHTFNQMVDSGKRDRDLKKILEDVKLTHIESREGGFDSIRDWQDVLSGGEKQRIGIARIFYHEPSFALLDECTSAVSIDVEESIYNLLIERGINLLTITHRPSLFKHHTHVLRFLGDGEWTFEPMDLNRELNNTNNTK